MLVEKAVRRVVKDIMRQDKKSIFFRPSEESASVERTSPPIKHPMKKEEAGKPVMNDPEHSRAHSEIIETCLGRSQSQEELGSWQRLEKDELHDELVQCQLGSASVKTVMKVCWASKNHEKETMMAWRN